MPTNTIKLGSLLLASLTLAACVEGTVVQNGESAPVPQTDLSAKFERDIAFATRTCFQALASKARSISIDPNTGFLPDPIQRLAFRNNRSPGPAVNIYYDPIRLRATKNHCVVRTVAGNNPENLATVDKTISALGYRSELVPGRAGKLKQQYVKGATVIEAFKSRTRSTYGSGLHIVFSSEG